MAKNKNNDNKVMRNKEAINLKDFMLLNNKKQDELLDSTLGKMYEDTFAPSYKHVEKILNIAFDNHDNEVVLPHNLLVKKEGNKLIFSFRKKKNGALIIILLLLALMTLGFATYTGVILLSKANLNIDLDGDGVPDLNIDLNDDGICDINCDTNKDKKPDQNIDYQNNRKATFNVLMEDGRIFNKMNQDTDGDGKCDINCDTNNDGFPDLFIDIDGDKAPDLNIDVDGDRKADLNFDTDGDGVCDINCDTNNDNKCDKNCISNLVKNNKGELNLDLDGDGKCDVNCDTNNDGLPDENIDYYGDKKSTFNKKGKNGNITNKTNQDLNNDGICDLNCDLDHDGWPDINLDIDGDGVLDLNIDLNGDGTPDLNIDTDGDGTPDINIDTDGDNKCDKNCIYDPTAKGDELSDDGKHGQYTGGESNFDMDTASLIVMFENGNDVSLQNLYPDDQTDEGVNTKVPDIKFTIKNTTNKTLYYNIDWVNIENTFESNNFWTKVVSDNGGYNKDWETAPFNDVNLVQNIAVAPNTTQSYTVSFTLHGTGTSQNYDQGRTFKGQIKIELLEG